MLRIPPPLPKDPEPDAKEARETEYGRLMPEDIIENQKRELEKFAAHLAAEAAKAEELLRENQALKEELRVAKSDRRDIEAAITNYFVEHYRA